MEMGFPVCLLAGCRFITELWSVGFTRHGGGACAPRYPSNYCWICKWAIHQAAEHLLSLLPPSLAPSVMHSYLGPCCGCCVTVRGGLAFLAKVLVMLWAVLYSAFYVHKVWERIFTVVSRGKESVVLHCHLFPLLLLQRQWLASNSRSSIVLGATGRLPPILQIVDTSARNCALHPGYTRWSYLKIKTLFFSNKALFKLKLLSGYMKVFLWYSQWID